MPFITEILKTISEQAPQPKISEQAPQPNY